MNLQPKWWLHSMTIWGVLVTAITTVLPAATPLLGLDMTGVLSQQLGEIVVRSLQTSGGVIGTILAILGRLRASSALTRRPLQIKI
jgi:Na+-transporting methylmalonyl-CoA/oxaloacetate decarboxylase beta subunit